MKKITTLFFGLLITSLTFSQAKVEKQITQAEQFIATAGTLIEKQLVDIGKVAGISVLVMKLKDLNSGTSKTALRFEYESSYPSETKIAILDLDEIDGLIKSMTKLKTTVFTSTRDVYTDVTFRSRIGFETGAFYEVDEAKWVAYFKLDKFDSNSTVYFNDIEYFTAMLTLVEQAKTKM